MLKANFENVSRFGALEHQPTGGSDPGGTPWQHLLLIAAHGGRVQVGAVVAPGAALTGTVDGDRWVLRLDPDGAHRVTAYGTLAIPLGVRSVLGLTGRCGVSRRHETVVVWPTRLLDDVVGEAR